MLATWQILDAATAARKRLLLAGFNPIPTNGKKPPMAGWPDTIATDSTIESWDKLFPDALNTGVLTRTTPAVDIDVYDADVAAEIEALLWDTIGTRGMVRFDNRRNARSCFGLRHRLRKYRRRSLSPSQQQHRVEVPCGGQPGDIVRADLPELTEVMAGGIHHQGHRDLRAQGWIEKPCI
jgi:hypothetical protein